MSAQDQGLSPSGTVGQDPGITGWTPSPHEGPRAWDSFVEKIAERGDHAQEVDGTRLSGKNAWQETTQPTLRGHDKLA